MDFNGREKQINSTWIPSRLSSFPSPSVICINMPPPLPPPDVGPAPKDPPCSCWIGLASENKRQLLCVFACAWCGCVFVHEFVLPLRRSLAPYVGPHLLAGGDYEIQGLIKTGFVYPPACTWRQQKQYDPTVAGPPPRTVRKAAVNSASQA